MVRIFAAGLCLRAVLEEEEEGKQGGQRLGFEVTNPCAPGPPYIAVGAAGLALSKL
jgi:hypothetical protein